MPDITNPQAVTFANEKARVFSEALLCSIRTARAFKDEYDANAMDAIFPATTDKIADGSAVDGRPQVTSNGIRALYTAASDMLTWAAVGSPTREARLRTFTDKGNAKF